MTRGELVIETLSAATGQSKEFCAEFLKRTNKAVPGGENFDTEIPDSELETLRSEFAKNMSGILAWFVRETMINLPPKGSA